MFTPRRLILVTTAILLLTAPAPAQQALDLIPEDAAFGLVVRNLDDLRHKGDQFFADNHIKEGRVPRPSAFFQLVYEQLQLKKGVDEKGAAAVILPNFKKAGIKKRDLERGDLGALSLLLNKLVFSVPVADLDAMGSNFGLEAGTLKEGQLTQGSGSNWALLPRGKHLLLGKSDVNVNRVANARPVTGRLMLPKQAALARADIAVLVGPKAMDDTWRDLLLKNLEQGMQFPGQDLDNASVEQLIAALRQVDFAVAGLRLDEGLKADLVISVPKGEAGADAAKFLSAVRAGPGTSDFMGLPKREPLILYAAKGDGERNALARTGLKLLLDQWLGIGVVVEEADRKKFLAAFETMYRRLKGSRSVTYRTSKDQAEKVGGLATILIMDVDKPEVHRQQWTRLVEVANNATPLITKQDRRSSPRFAFKPATDKLDGKDVDVLTVEIPDIQPAVDQEYRRLLGPDWNKVRMVVQDQHVVALIGSDVEALRETLANLKTGARELAEDRTVTAHLERLSPQRSIEAHFDLRNRRR